MNMNVSFLSRRLVRIRAKDLYPLCFVPEPRSPSYFLIVAVPKLFFLFIARLTLSPLKMLWDILRILQLDWNFQFDL